MFSRLLHGPGANKGDGYFQICRLVSKGIKSNNMFSNLTFVHFNSHTSNRVFFCFQAKVVLWCFFSSFFYWSRVRFSDGACMQKCLYIQNKQNKIVFGCFFLDKVTGLIALYPKIPRFVTRPNGVFL